MALKIGLIDYGMGNLFSIKNALETQNVEVITSRNYQELINTDAIILPGVGSFNKAMENIRNFKLDKLIYDFIDTGKLFLGICLGMQLLFSSSTENEFTNGLNLLKGKVIRFNNENTPNLVPRVDWAKTDFFITDGITLGLEKIEYMYYVHSFYVVPEGNYSILSESYYCDVKYCSGIKYKNIYAFQFHPEKSSIKGLLLIRNFLAQVAKFKGEQL